ncbi:MAG: pantoate--beta-alanine ligase [Gammaproteobacteria bacterium]|nr:pantoate--beta-alanine ligase [Gammaproteobacteria bacterium]
MHVSRQLEDLRQRVADWHLAGERVAFVPTMGNLHAGHLALVEKAREVADRVVASIFVNPMQFGPNEDFGAYPRTEDQDAQQLVKAGCDLLFLPDVETMYPGGTEATTFIEVPEISDILCGQSRPGHFRGVATVVARLFHMVQPDAAVFGEKDWQQLQVIRRMVRDLALPVEIIGLPTKREDSGLALSSRNQYLDAAEREQAAELYQALRAAAQGLQAGESVAVLEKAGRERLARAGFEVDYFTIRNADTLQEVAAADAEAVVVLAAARLGKARLIDNLPVNAAS